MAVHGLLIAVASLVVEHWPEVLVTLRQVEFSQIRDRTHVSFFDRQMFIHCPTKEVLYYIFFIHSFVDGHLGHLGYIVVAIVNSATVNIGVHVSF